MVIPRNLAIAAALAVLILSGGGPYAQADTVGDHLWIWGHPAGSYNAGFLRPLKLVSKIEPVAAAQYMGVKNMIFVRYNDEPAPPFDAYYNPFRKLDRVYWSLVGAGGGTSQAARGGLLAGPEEQERGGLHPRRFLPRDERRQRGRSLAFATARSPVQRLARPGPTACPRPAASRRPEAAADGRDLHPPGKAGARFHIAEVDQVCMWTWRPEDLKHLEANFAALEKVAPDKQLFLGCYMYGFYECKPLPVALMQRQVELGYQWLKAGRIAGMIFLATPNVDVGLEAVEWTRRWIHDHADQPLPTRGWVNGKAWMQGTAGFGSVGRTLPPVA